MQPTGLMNIMTRESEFSLRVSFYFRAPPGRLIIIACPSDTCAFDHFPNRTQMVARIVVIAAGGPSDYLNSLIIEELGHVCAAFVPFFRQAVSAPDKSLVR